MIREVKTNSYTLHIGTGEDDARVQGENVLFIKDEHEMREIRVFTRQQALSLIQAIEETLRDVESREEQLGG